MSNDKTVTPHFSAAGTIINSESKGGLTKANKPYFFLTYTILCGEEILRLTQSSSDGSPLLPVPKGTLVKIAIQANYKDNGVIPLDGAVEAA